MNKNGLPRDKYIETKKQSKKPLDVKFNINRGMFVDLYG